MVSQYQEFVKKHYPDVKHLPIKERFPAIAKMWAEHKAGGKPKAVKKGKAKGGMLVAGALYDPKHSFISDIFKM